MSLTRSHPLHQQLLRFSQVMLHRRKIWLERRQAAYDLRDRNEEKLYEQTRSARVAGDFVLASEIEEQRARAYASVKAAIDRFNYGVPIDVIDPPGGIEEKQHHAHLIAGADASSTPAESFDPAALAVLISEISPPPGDVIRSTPRRPGAPFAVLPR